MNGAVREDPGPPPLELAERLSIRSATRGDLGGVLEVERSAFSTPWSPASFRSLLGLENVIFLVADLAGRVVGHVVLWRVGEEGELANLAVRPGVRRRGVGGALLETALGHGASAGLTRVFLEVRVSNDRARCMYSRQGFQQVGIRRGYYRNPVEDALLLRLDLAGPSWRGDRTPDEAPS